MCSEKSGKTGKNAPSVTGGQRAVTLCASVAPEVVTKIDFFQHKEVVQAPFHNRTLMRLSNSCNFHNFGYV